MFMEPKSKFNVVNSAINVTRKQQTIVIIYADIFETLLVD